jgi:hypothetical protein
MASPPSSSQLDTLAGRPFAFYPPIIGLEHNEWVFRKASWSEILVANRKTGEEIWLSRRFVGEVSRVDEPVLIVGLAKELEYKGGMVVPSQRRVIDMPPAPAGNAPAAGSKEPYAPTLIGGIAPASPQDKRVLKLIGAVLAFALVAYVVMVAASHRRVVFKVKDQTNLGLTSRDDRTAVVAKLGEPASDRWQSETGTMQYEALAYPGRHLTVILMGSDRKGVLYIGALDDEWQPVNSIAFHSGGSTDSLLRNLKRF